MTSAIRFCISAPKRELLPQVPLLRALNRHQCAFPPVWKLRPARTNCCALPILRQACCLARTLERSCRLPSHFIAPCPTRPLSTGEGASSLLSSCPVFQTSLPGLHLPRPPSPCASNCSCSASLPPTRGVGPLLCANDAAMACLALQDCRAPTKLRKHWRQGLRTIRTGPARQGATWSLAPSLARTPLLEVKTPPRPPCSTAMPRRPSPSASIILPAHLAFLSWSTCPAPAPGATWRQLRDWQAKKAGA
jgi:hypothetical protein